MPLKKPRNAEECAQFYAEEYAKHLGTLHELRLALQRERHMRAAGNDLAAMVTDVNSRYVADAVTEWNRAASTGQ